MNLDETCLSFDPGSTRGLVAQPGAASSSAAAASDVAPWRQSKAGLTHVAIIVDSPSLQPRMPQVLIVGQRTCSVKAVAHARSTCPDNVHILHQKSSWNAAETMLHILDLLGDALKPRAGQLWPVLLLDTAPQHLSPEVCQKALSRGIHLLFVPALCTWLLQPLDTHAFFGYKARLRRVHRRLQQLAGGGAVGQGAWLAAMSCEASAYFCRRRWRRAFESVGACPEGLQHAGLSSALQARVSASSLSSVRSVRPSHSQLQAIFPRNKRRPHAGLFLPGLPSRRMRKKAPWPTSPTADLEDAAGAGGGA